jgi:hypothetical protein
LDYVGLESIKQGYAQTLLDNGNKAKAMEVYNKKISEPIFDGMALHGETEPIKADINMGITDIAMDLVALNKEIMAAGNKYADLVNNVRLRLSSIEDRISAEEDRIRDINVICGNYNQFDGVVAITPYNITEGTYNYQEGTWRAYDGGQATTVELKVTDVEGNGIEGNSYVVGEDNDYSSRDHLVDDDALTSWEYSRYTATTKQNNAPVPVNLDTEDARCTITLKGAAEFNSIKIQTYDNIVVEEAATTTDEGVTYQASMANEIHMNDKKYRYDNPNYIYDSGIIAFPATKYLKLTLRSCDVTNDKIANDKGTVFNGITRHRIHIDGITADGSNYTTASFTTKELISSGDEISSIAIFANEYVPASLDEGTYFTYTLTVNGSEYSVVPINSQREGTKMIRYSDYSVGDSYVKHLSETIKSAKLKVTIYTKNSTTPYLSNLKVCFGKVAVQ